MEYALRRISGSIQETSAFPLLNAGYIWGIGMRCTKPGPGLPGSPQMDSSIPWASCIDASMPHAGICLCRLMFSPTRAFVQLGFTFISQPVLFKFQPDHPTQVPTPISHSRVLEGNCIAVLADPNMYSVVSRWDETGGICGCPRRKGSIAVDIVGARLIARRTGPRGERGQQKETLRCSQSLRLVQQNTDVCTFFREMTMMTMMMMIIHQVRFLQDSIQFPGEQNLIYFDLCHLRSSKHQMPNSPDSG